MSFNSISPPYFGVADLPGIVADRGERQPVLRGGQPVAVLRAATAGDCRVLHVHLEKGEPAQGARRACAQRRQPGAAVQDEGDHHDTVRGGAVRAVVGAVVSGVLADQVRRAAARRRDVHRGLAARGAMVGCRQLVHQPAAVRHIQPAVPRGLQGVAVRQDVPGAGLRQQLGQVPEWQGRGRGHRPRPQPAQARRPQDHRRHLRAPTRGGPGRRAGHRRGGRPTRGHRHRGRQTAVRVDARTGGRSAFRVRGPLLSGQPGRQLVRVTRPLANCDPSPL